MIYSGEGLQETKNAENRERARPASKLSDEIKITLMDYYKLLIRCDLLDEETTWDDFSNNVFDASKLCLICDLSGCLFFKMKPSSGSCCPWFNNCCKNEYQDDISSFPTTEISHTGKLIQVQYNPVLLEFLKQLCQDGAKIQLVTTGSWDINSVSDWFKQQIDEDNFIVFNDKSISAGLSLSPSFQSLCCFYQCLACCLGYKGKSAYVGSTTQWPGEEEPRVNVCIDDDPLQRGQDCFGVGFKKNINPTTTFLPTDYPGIMDQYEMEARVSVPSEGPTKESPLLG